MRTEHYLGVVRCRTQQEAEKLFEYLDRQGYRWSTGSPLELNRTNHDMYEENTIYYIPLHPCSGVMYGSEKYHEANQDREIADYCGDLEGFWDFLDSPVAVNADDFL